MRTRTAKTAKTAKDREVDVGRSRTVLRFQEGMVWIESEKVQARSSKPAPALLSLLSLHALSINALIKSLLPDRRSQT